MVESTNPELDQQDSALAFFDDVFNTVQGCYRHIDPAYLKNTASKKKLKTGAGESLSLVDLAGRASAKIEQL